MDLYGTIQPVQHLEGLIMLVPSENGDTKQSGGIVDAMLLADGGVYGQVVNATFEDLEVS